MDSLVMKIIDDINKREYVFVEFIKENTAKIVHLVSEGYDIEWYKPLDKMFWLIESSNRRFIVDFVAIIGSFIMGKYIENDKAVSIGQISIMDLSLLRVITNEEKERFTNANKTQG